MGAVLASGVLLSTAMIGPIPADAAGGTSCKVSKGTATFTPALPKLGSSTKVFAKLGVVGTISGCTGGGVTSGKVKVTTQKPKTASNCETLAAYDATPTTGTEIITWNNGKTSTIALKLLDVKGNAIQARVQGTVTAGLFKGLKQNGLTQYKLPSGGCTSAGLSKVTYATIGASTIK